MFFEFLEEDAELATGAHGGDADTGGFPIDEVTDLVDRLFLEIEKANDHSLARIEMGEEAFQKIAREAG